ncbi:hypothetical protein PM082_022344 [Marasmius tenuissimus]|nr:hypothetical protein PM082_022344 [Marasmius tenuissimus]
MSPHSPFSSVLCTNYAPTQGERQQIKSILLEPVQELERLDQQILRLQAQRAELKSFIDNHQALLSPSRKMPEELWREVFSWLRLLPQEVDLIPCRKTTTPLSLTAVCRQWYAVATSTPQLWRSISVGIPKSNSWFRIEMRPLGNGSQQGVTSWLKRSGTLPLDLSLYGEGDSVTKIAQTFVHFSRRWKSLNLVDVGKEGVELLAGADAPLLEAIFLISKRRLDSSQAAGLFQCLAKHPRLHTLSLHIQFDITIMMNTTTQWSHLTTLYLSIFFNDPPAAHIIVTLANLCPLLSTCIVRCISTPGNRVIPEAPIHAPILWPHIQKLDLSFWIGTLARRNIAPDLSSVSRALDAITTPALTDLAFIFGAHQAASPSTTLLFVPPFHHFLKRSGCNGFLVCLTVELLWGVDSVLGLLATVPSLKTLRIMYASDMEASDEGRFMHSLTSREICPALESIEVLNFSASQADVILELLEARRRGLAHNTFCLSVKSLRPPGTPMKDSERLDHDLALQPTLDRLKQQGVVVV